MNGGRIAVNDRIENIEAVQQWRRNEPIGTHLDGNSKEMLAIR